MTAPAPAGRPAVVQPQAAVGPARRAASGLVPVAVVDPARRVPVVPARRVPVPLARPVRRPVAAARADPARRAGRAAGSWASAPLAAGRVATAFAPRVVHLLAEVVAPAEVAEPAWVPEPVPAPGRAPAVAGDGPAPVAIPRVRRAQRGR